MISIYYSRFQFIKCSIWKFNIYSVIFCHLCYITCRTFCLFTKILQYYEKNSKMVSFYFSEIKYMSALESELPVLAA